MDQQKTMRRRESMDSQPAQSAYRMDPKLPMELFYRVVECLDRKRDYDTLRACSTVCKAFLPQCQRVLFHSIDLSSNSNRIDSFLSILKQKPHLASLIRRFQYLIGKYAEHRDKVAIDQLVLPNVQTLVINGWMTYTVPVSEHGHRAIAHLLCWPSIRTIKIQGFKTFPLHHLRRPIKMRMLYISPAGLSDGDYLVDAEPPPALLANEGSQDQLDGSVVESIKLEHLIIDRNVSSALLRKLSDAAPLCNIDVSALTAFQLALKPAGREAQSWPKLMSALCDFLQLLRSLRTFQVTLPLYYNQPKIDLTRILSTLLPTLTSLSIHWSGSQVDEEWLLNHLSDVFIAIHDNSRLERVQLALEYTKIPLVPPTMNAGESNWRTFAKALTTNGSSSLRELRVHLSICDLRGISKRAWQDHYMDGPRSNILQAAREHGFYLDFRVFWVQIQSGALRQPIEPLGR